MSAQFASLPITKEGRKFFLNLSHYVLLMRIPNIDECHFYEIEAVRNGWGVKKLGRQYDSALYVRLALSRDKEGIDQLSTEGKIIEKPEDCKRQILMWSDPKLPQPFVSWGNSL